MYHMEKATVRDLRYNFRKIEELLRNGGEIQITKRKRVIARVLPPAEDAPFQAPDFAGQMREIFGKKKLKINSAKLLARERDRY
jgi:antitoxin (DNA-binding transcriptional repressor) of toxin-antitoxin stability system